MTRGIAVLALVSSLALAAAAPVRAQVPSTRLDSAEDVHRACRESEQHGRRTLYVVRIPPSGWSFGDYRPDEERLVLAERRNLRAFEGAVELFPSDLEPVGLVASRERARKLRAVAEAGASLRVGFFLGFDNPHRTSCLLRPRFGVSTVRMDVAFVEIVGSEGRVLAREDTDRLRAWKDDLERDRVPGSGPRGALGAAMLTSASGIAPEAWQRALGAAHQGPVGKALARCHREGVERGAAKRGQVVVRLRVDVASGEVREAAVELSTIEHERETACIADALVEHLQLPPAPDELSQATIDISVPVHLAD